MKINEIKHPRPDFMRENWLSLNGVWQFQFDDDNIGEEKKWYLSSPYSNQITVPYVYQSSASGINDFSYHPIMWYQKNLILPSNFTQSNVLLHFGAVDYHAKVWINGLYLGSHQGGYTPFHFDITTFLLTDAPNTITIKVVDTHDCSQPRGKQYWKDYDEMCWYYSASGIWQSVWIENLGSNHFNNIKITPDIDHKLALFEYSLECSNSQNLTQIHVKLYHKNYLFSRKRYYHCSTATANDSMESQEIQTLSYNCTDQNNRFILSIKEEEFIKDIHYWSPENPHLYGVEITLIENGQIQDIVTTYFGMRKIECQHGIIYLNNQPYYQKLVLDQGYWESTHVTPPSPESLKTDIENAKKLGFNGARKHQKIEDPYYYYWADMLGFLVWGELPSTYDFTPNSIRNSTSDLYEFIERDYNHPCIITWVPLNESWGVRNIFTDSVQQSFAACLYHLIKSLDSTRLVSNNDGWEIVDSTDIYGLHDYSAIKESLSPNYTSKEQLMTTHGQYKPSLAQHQHYNSQTPLLITEYGGIAFTDSTQTSWGYCGQVNTIDEFMERFSNITLAFRSLPYVNGYCYTQLYDVYQEKNGLLTMDRKFKIDPGFIKAVIEQ